MMIMEGMHKVKVEKKNNLQKTVWQGEKPLQFSINQLCVHPV